MIASVAFPVTLAGIYDYHIPEDLIPQIVLGSPVQVELKHQILWGVVVEIKKKSSYPQLKMILATKPDQWTDSNSTLIKLYSWIATYYHSDLGKVCKPLIRKAFVNTKPKTITNYRFCGIKNAHLTKKQMMAAKKLVTMTDALPSHHIQEKYNISAYMIPALVAKNILQKEKTQIIRKALELDESKKQEEQIILSSEQEKAVNTILKRSQNDKKPVLLHGITGSGKTYVYIELVRRIIEKGKKVIILIPEISLTPQTIKRFRNALHFDLAVIHSKMSDGERRDTLAELVSGRKKLVIGVRSAILVPMDNVGLIIVDEEHDTSYKQSDPEPRYHARDVAVMRGHFQNAQVILGSATPSLESYYNALQGKYTAITLAQRYGKACLPKVHIVDMNREHKNNNWTFLSRYLQKKIQQTLDYNRQIILLLNRRGFSVSLLCKECGYIYVCPHCSVKLIYHKSLNLLRCHQCDFSLASPDTCVKCNGEQILYKGMGIQKAEEYLNKIFPRAKILRMDQDTMKKKGQYLTIFEKFANKEADILLGTQMVAKGLSFPGVKLVGVIQADIGLHFPDFRASERTFQLLTQVSGRAGRKDSLGEVIIQTYSPREPGIRAVQNHDFKAFFSEEIKSRKLVHYPPFCRLVRVILKGPDEALVQTYITKIADEINQTKMSELTVLGPSPAMVTKINNNFRYSLIMKSKSPEYLKQVITKVKKKFNRLPGKMLLILDVDPVNMM